jgi:hypothetical protein
MIEQARLTFGAPKRKSQAEAVLDHMKAGKAITPALAYELCGTLALHSRISELRERGYDVQKEMVARDGKTFGSYTLPPEQRVR